MPKPEQRGRMWGLLRHLMGDVHDAGVSVTHAAHEIANAEPPGPAVPLHSEVHFEHSDISARGTVIAGYGVLVGTGIIVALLYLYFSFLSNYRARLSPPPLAIEAHGNPMPPEPRIQNAPRLDLEGQRAFENSVLNKYWWVDRQKGVVGIPIERAMEMLVQRGIPPQTAPPELKLFPPQTGDRSVGFVGKVAPEPR
jgi:hypothetical protein